VIVANNAVTGTINFVPRLCTPQPTTLTFTPNTPTNPNDLSYQWSNNGGNTQSIVVTPTTASFSNPYTVTVTHIPSGCTSTAYGNIPVYPVQAIPVFTSTRNPNGTYLFRMTIPVFLLDCNITWYINGVPVNNSTSRLDQVNLDLCNSNQIYVTLTNPNCGTITTSITETISLAANGTATIGTGASGEVAHSQYSNTYIWNAAHQPNITGDIIVPPYTTLFIENVTVNMPQGSRIIVEPRGRLVINSSKITSSCTWKGIELRTDPNSYLWASADIEESLIENAEIAIVAGINDGGTGSDLGSAFIQCRHTTFKNNVYDIWCAWNKHTGNGDYWDFSQPIEIFLNGEWVTWDPVYGARGFYKCLFLTDNDYRFDTNNGQPPVHICVLKNNGIKVVGSDFINENTNLMYQGAGIATVLGSYKVIGAFNDPSEAGSSVYPRSTSTNAPQTYYGHFKGLEYGVYSTAELPGDPQSPRTQPCIVSHQAFDDCRNGIYFHTTQQIQ
jgi:hypothetical protein